MIIPSFLFLLYYLIISVGSIERVCWWMFRLPLSQDWRLLATYAPNQMSGDVAKHFRQLHPTLDDYNNGRVGPGHCSDDSILFGGN